VIKRCIDILLVFTIAPVLLPTMFMLAMLIRISTPGPILFSHRRIGRNGAFFAMWKFRTMCNNSTEVLQDYLSSHPEARAEWRKTHKLRNDPRISRLGLFLRRYSLDELPQVWNVLTGQMTLVGPRPIVAAEAEKYGSEFGWYCTHRQLNGLMCSLERARGCCEPVFYGRATPRAVARQSCSACVSRRR